MPFLPLDCTPLLAFSGKTLLQDLEQVNNLSLSVFLTLNLDNVLALSALSLDELEKTFRLFCLKLRKRQTLFCFSSNQLLKLLHRCRRYGWLLLQANLLW